MRLRIAIRFIILITITTLVTPAAAQSPPSGDKGTRLEDLTWPDAERLLGPETVVVIPLGAAAKEHGPHLKLRNDLTLAEYLTRRVVDATNVIVAPTIAYHYYPAFLEYPGSTSLSLQTARDLTVQVIRSLTAYGPRRFYVLNTGVSTLRALEPATEALANDGVLVRYTDLSSRLDPLSRRIQQQEGGTHADEIETSMMLYVDPASVDMSKAVKDYQPSTGSLKLTRQRGGEGTYSPTGVWGDPTLATRDKGRIAVEALVTGILDDIRFLRTSSLPIRRTATTATTPLTNAPSMPVSTERVERPETCSPGDERTIRRIGDAFTTHWANGDAQNIGLLWAPGGDMVHPDGTIERGRDQIIQNRARLFASRQYRFSKHPLSVTVIRCLSADIAVADGKWELRGLMDANGQPQPPLEGQATLVVKRTNDWLIEAYRYTIKAPPAPTTPTLQKKPGLPDSIIK